MPKSKKPRVDGSALKRLRKCCRGLVVEWDDRNPESESEHVVNGRVTHTNPVMRHAAASIWSEIGSTLASRISMRWLVRIIVVFRYPNGQEQHEERELEARCILDRLNDFALEQIEDAMRHGAKEHYVTTKFHVECLGA